MKHSSFLFARAHLGSISVSLTSDQVLMSILNVLHTLLMDNISDTNAITKYLRGCMSFIGSVTNVFNEQHFEK